MFAVVCCPRSSGSPDLVCKGVTGRCEYQSALPSWSVMKLVGIGMLVAFGTGSHWSAMTLFGIGYWSVAALVGMTINQ